MKNRLRKPVALLGTLVMAGAFLITGNSAVANAGEVSATQEWRYLDGRWRIERHISNSTPTVGDIITVTSTFWRHSTLRVTTSVKDVHDPCLKYVAGSLNRDGTPYPNPQVANPDPDATDVGYVRVPSDWSVNAGFANWGSAHRFQLQYEVTEDCLRDTDLVSTIHWSGVNGESPQPSAFNGGPYIQVQKDATSVALAADPTTAEVDQNVTFTVTTTGIGDGETVDISGDGTGDGTATVNGNTATFTRSFDSTGSKNVTVSFAGNDIAKPAGPATASVEIKKITSGVSIGAASPAFINTVVPLTATTTGIPDGEPVEFRVGTQILGNANVSSGKAVFNGWTPTTKGNYTIRAEYAGSATVAPSESPQISVNVSDPIQQTTTTLAVDPDPVPGQASTLTATVNDGNDGDTVEFLNDGQRIGTAILSGGTASTTWTPTAKQANQPYNLTAHYVGSTGYAPSTSDPVTGTVGLVQTTVSVVDAPGTGIVGEQIPLSATITDGAANQMIEFRDGDGNVLSLIQLDGTGQGIVTAYWAPTTTGTYQVTAHYLGTSDTSPANSPSATTITVGAKQSSIELDGPASASVGQPTTLTATTTGIADGETVTFEIDGEQDRPVQVNNGQAVLEWTPSATGNYGIRALYAGSDDVEASESEVLDVVVGLAHTQTSTVTASNDPVTGAPVTLSATVSGGTEGVDVVFRDGTTDLCTAQLDGDGTATCQWTPDRVGTADITAHYAGDDATEPSQSPNATTVDVGQGDVAQPSNLVVTPANPSADQPVTVSGTAPVGSLVEVYTTDNSQKCSDTATADGTFTCELGPLPVGTQEISAVATLNGKRSSIANTTVTVAQVIPTLTLAGPASVKPDQAAELTLTTTGIPDGETVDILVDGSVHGQATVNGNTATYPWTPSTAGTYTISASYGGSDSVADEVSNALTITVDTLSTNTTNVLASSAAVPVGDTVTLSATVHGGTEGIAVQFRNGEYVLCSGETGADGTASCEWETDAVGTVNVVAHYPGDAGVNNPSHSAQPTTIDVGKTASTVNLTATSPVEVGGTVTFELDTTGIADGQTVDILVDGNVVASPAVSGGTATVTWTAPATPGTLTAIAQYEGTTTVAGSESEQVTIEVGKAATSITDVTAASEATVGAPTTLSATVTGGTEGDTVEFRDGTAVLCTGQVGADGSVDCPWTPTTAGTVTVTAHYLGSDTTAASTSEGETTITVAEAPDTEAPDAPTGITVTPQPVTVGDQVTVTGEAEADSTVSVMVDGVEVCQTTATGGTFECGFAATDGMDGQQVTVTATDAAGNTSDAADGGTLQVEPAVVDPTEPTITVTPAQPVAGQEVEIEVTGDAGEELVITDGTTEICRVTLGQDGTATCQWTPAEDGQVVLTVTVGEQTVEKTVTVRPADDNDDDDDNGDGDGGAGSGSLDSGSLGSLTGGAGGNGSSGSLGSLSSFGS